MAFTRTPWHVYNMLNGPKPKRPRASHSGQSVVEQKVRAKLHEIDSIGLVLGAQARTN